MQVNIKITQEIFKQAKRDLLRPSKFGCERIGFFSTRCSKTSSRILVHCVGYTPVQDEHYIKDYSVGVRIGPKAITSAMTRSVADSVGQIHVHMHGGQGMPYPSPMDSQQLPPLLKSLRNANSREAHGWMIIGEQDAWSEILLPEYRDSFKESSFSIIGFPTVVNHRITPIKESQIMKWLKRFGNDRQSSHARYDRQSFLGPQSEEIIAQTVIGVVGLGGGGSHIIQQLSHLGFKNFVLCDDDFITDSNLNRLVGGTSDDIWHKKTKLEISERTIRGLHKDAHMIGRDKKWESVSGDLCGCNIIIGCVDKFCVRRDLEAFCRRHMIPYVDVGMDVHKSKAGDYEIFGQVILSMPGELCMKCMGFLTEKVLSEEADNYGAAGSRPQVVWSNGILCSAAVGIVTDLLTDWSKKSRSPVFLAFRGSELSLMPDKRVLFCQEKRCHHFPLEQIGDPKFTPL